MSAPSPLSVRIDPMTGAVSPSTGRYVKRLSELGGIFHDQTAWATALHDGGDRQVYEVIEVRQPGNDLFFGTTIIAPGSVGGEFFMTRGHFHRRPDRGETYATLSGKGLLLLQDRLGNTEVIEMQEGGIAAIPPDWAHRSINVGDVPLVFSWVCSVDAGNDYGPILERGMRKLVLSRDGGPALIDNPRA